MYPTGRPSQESVDTATSDKDSESGPRGGPSPDHQEILRCSTNKIYTKSRNKN